MNLGGFWRCEAASNERSSPSFVGVKGLFTVTPSVEVSLADPLEPWRKGRYHSRRNSGSIWAVIGTNFLKD